MASKRYDVVILGGGNAAMGATVATRAAGMSVALVEARDLGGTCPNRGCTPKKVLVAAAHALDEIEKAKTHAITVGKPVLDWSALIAREKGLIADIPERLGRQMAQRGVEVLRGEAKFVAPQAVAVDGQRIEAGHIVIATGSKPRTLPIRGFEHAITSDDVLSNKTLPHDVVFIGGGVIALEFGHVYARAGARVTILEVLPRLLPALDADAVEALRAESERIGIRIETSVAVEGIEKAGSRLHVAFSRAGVAHVLAADQVVNGAGRVPNTETLALEAGNVRHDRGRVAVDEYLRSVSNPAVYLCGDVLASPQLSPIATYEGNIVGRNIVDGGRHKPDYASIPSCVFTIPTLATVGLTEAAAKEKGFSTKVQVNDLTGWLSGRTYAESAAWVKVILDATTDRILGAHIFGHAGEELIHFFALAMRHTVPAQDIREMVFAFPSFSADIKYML
jgi:glutathione reductase (NADPH)